jgi:hypothetical protein
MYLINDVELISGIARGELYLFPQTSDVVHAGMRSGINLNQIYGPAIINGLTHLAVVAGLCVSFG